MNGSLDRDVGALEARVEAVEGELRDLKRDMREIRDAIVTVRGGWKLLTLVVAISASLGAALAKFIPWAGSLPR